MYSEKQEKFTALDMRLWNLRGSFPRFTKEDHADGYGGVSAFEMCEWNNQGNAPLYTKKEHSAAEGLRRSDLVEWNRTGNEPEYTEEEQLKLY